MRTYYMEVKAMPRFKVGDVVEYDRGEVADRVGLPRIVRATIRVVQSIQDDALYTITYGSQGIATVGERELEWMFDPMEPDCEEIGRTTRNWPRPPGGDEFMRPDYDALAREEPTSQYQDNRDSAEVRA